MSKNYKEANRIGRIIAKQHEKFPNIDKKILREIWLNGFAEGKQKRVFLTEIQNCGSISVEKHYYK